MSVMTPEGKVKQFIKKFMLLHYPDAWQYCPMGGPYGKGGVPDFLYLHKGLLIAIEAKADRGVVSESQKQQMKLITENGGICAVVRGKDIEKMNAIKAAIDARIADDPQS